MIIAIFRKIRWYAGIILKEMILLAGRVVFSGYRKPIGNL